MATVSWSVIRPLLIAIIVAQIALLITYPASKRELSLDDVVHVSRYAQENQNRSVLEVFRLPHWQDVGEEIHWRPVAKLLWRYTGVAEDQSTRGLWLITALLAGGCAALLAICLGGGRRTGLYAALPLLNPLAADVLLPFVGQADLLALLGVLAAWALWRNGGVLRLVAGATCLLLAMLAKESAYPATLAIPVVLWFGEGTRRIRRRRAIRTFVVATVTLAVRLTLQVSLFGSMLPRAGQAGGFAVGDERSVGMFETLGRHAVGFIVPMIPQTDYSFLKQPGSEVGLFPIIGAAALICFFSALLVLLWPRRVRQTRAHRVRSMRLVVAGLLWAAIMLVPYANVVPLGALWAGRFLLLPFVGSAMVIKGIEGLLPGRWRWAPVVFALVMCHVGGIAIHRRAEDWKTPLALWTAEVERQPDHAFAWKNLAAHLQWSGDDARALDAIRRATTLWPTFGDAWLARGQIARANGQNDEAMHAFIEAERLLPHSAQVQLEIAKLDAAQGRFAEAERRLSALIEANPDHAEAHAVLEQVRRDLGR